MNSVIFENENLELFSPKVKLKKIILISNLSFMPPDYRGAAKRPIRKTKENIGKQKKTCFFLFLFCFFKVFLISALAQEL